MSSAFAEHSEMPECNDFDASQTVKIASKIASDLLKDPTLTKVNKYNTDNEADLIMPEVPFNNGINHICALEPSVTKLAEAAAVPDMILHSKYTGLHDTESNVKVKNANQECLGVTPAVSSKMKNAFGCYYDDSFSVSPTAESSASKVKRSRGRPRKKLKSSTSNWDQYLLPSELSVNNLRMDDNDIKSNKNVLYFSENKSAIHKKRATKRLNLNKDEISQSTKFLPTDEIESIAAEVSYVLNVSQLHKSNEIKPINLSSKIISSSENQEFSNHSKVVDKVNNVILEVKKPRGRPKKNQNKTQTVKVLSVDSQLQNTSNTDAVELNSHEASIMKNVSEDQSTLTEKEKLILGGNECLGWSKFYDNKTLKIKRCRGRPKKYRSKMSDTKVSTSSRSLLKKANKRDLVRNVNEINDLHSEVSPEEKLSALNNESLKTTEPTVDRSLKVERHREQTKWNHSKSSLPDANISSCLENKVNKKKIRKNKGPKQINEIYLEVKTEDQTFNENKSDIHSNKRVKIINDKFMSNKDIGASLLALQNQPVKTRKKKLMSPKKGVKSKTTKDKKSRDFNYKEKNKSNKKGFKSIVIHIKKENKLFLKKKISSFETFHNNKTSEYITGSVNLSDFQPIKEDSSLKTNEISTKSWDESKKHSHHTLLNSQSTDLLSEYKPQKWLWRLLKEKDSREYCPLMKLSPYFKSERTWNGRETNWRILKAFESEPLDDESCHNTFFTGGASLCVAWCPIPGDGINNQYIALAVNISVDEYHTYECLDSGKCLIQVWNVGILNSQKLKSKPTVELIIAQDHGIITGIRWCPSGCWEDPSNDCSDDILPRLGILAVAYSDSYVRIYSIPHPHLLTEELTFPIYETSPSIILQPLFGSNCCVTEKTMCVSLDWQKLDLCERVAAGYGNGMICVWHITSTSILLVSKENNATKISPYLVFNAHGTPVTSLSFAPIPGGRFLLSSSYDKTLKFWDLTDVSLPFCAVRKGITLCADWADLCCGAFSSLEHGFNLRDACFLQECGLEKFTNRLLSTPNCPTTKISVSKFLNAIAMVDTSGSLSVSFYRNLLDDKKPPYYFHRPVYLTEITPIQGILEKRFFSSLSEKFNKSCAVQEMKDIVSLMNEVLEKTSAEENLKPNFVDETKKSETHKSRCLSLSDSTSTDQLAEFKTSIECRSDLLPTDIANSSDKYNAVCDISMDNESSTEYYDEIPFTQVFGDEPFVNFKDDAESVISLDSTSSNSENELSVIDREMDESFFLGKKLELSDDSIISECSLNSNMEFDSSSVDWIFSDKIYKNEVNESNSKKVFLYSNSNSPSKLSPESSDFEILISEKFQNFPSGIKEESDIFQNKSAALNPTATCDNQIEKFETAQTFAKEDKSCTKPIANNRCKNLSAISRNFDELNRDPISSDLSLGAFSNVFSKRFSGNISSSHFEVFQDNRLYASDITTDHKYDENSCDSGSTRNKTYISDTYFAANSDKRKANSVNMYFENKLLGKCSKLNVFSEVAEKDIFEIKKSPDTNTDCNCYNNNNNKSVPCENSPTFDAKATTSTPFSHANGGSHCGLVFKDMNTADFENIGDAYIKEDSILLFEKDPILSVKAVAWNPNYNSHSWLFSACHSGIARLSYISDMQEWKYSKKNKKTL